MTTASELDRKIRDMARNRKKYLAESIANTENGQDVVYTALYNLLSNARNRCISEMCNDLVTTYILIEDFSVVNYGKLRQMGMALGIIKEFNKEERSKVQYGEFYFCTHIVGLSKLCVYLKRKKKFLFW